MELVNTIDRTTSARLFEEAKKYFPGGVNSPVRAFKSVSGPPLFIRRGDGCRIEDEDGNTFIDFCCSWGPLILGHNDPKVRQMVLETVARGTSFGTPTRLGNELGQLIVDHHRFIQKIRFVSSGTEAVMSAIRLARGATGRSKVLKFEGCYHGHVDSLLVKAGSGLATFGVSTSAGIPESFAKETLVVPLGRPDLLEETLHAHGQEIACIIMEPIPANNGLLLQKPGFLQSVRQLCDTHGILLIFDEVISGFRIGFEGAAGHYQIQPDMMTFGKIIGGGMPVGAYAANAVLMGHIVPEGPVYQAGTLSANPVAMAAGYATLQQCLEPGFYEELEQKTSAFAKAINSFAQSKALPLQVQQIGSIFWLAFSEKPIWRADQIDAKRMEYFKTLHHELLQNGIYLGPSGYEVGFVSAAHDEASLSKATEIICECLERVFQ